MRAVVVLLIPLLAACGPSDRPPQVEAASATASSAAPPSPADRLCSAVAAQEAGQVAGAFDTTVQQVRDYVINPHGAAGDPSAPHPGPYDFPAGWGGKQSADAAAACYLDGPLGKSPPPAGDGTTRPPFDRRLVLAADQAEQFTFGMGYQATMPLRVLPRY